MMNGPSKGWAIERGGILLVDTVADTRRVAIWHGCRMADAHLLGICEKPKCDCMECILAQVAPDARIVEVNVTVRPNE